MGKTGAARIFFVTKNDERLNAGDKEGRRGYEGERMGLPAPRENGLTTPRLLLSKNGRPTRAPKKEKIVRRKRVHPRALAKTISK